MAFTVSPQSEPVPAMYWLRTFDGCPREAREVRRFVSALLPTCSRLDEILLVVDELVVNALRHTKSGQAGGSFTVEVAGDGERVAVSVVDDGGPAEPTVIQADDLDESGRGLTTVSQLATTWGWHGNSESRTVHAAFDVGVSWAEASPADIHGLRSSYDSADRPARAVGGENGDGPPGRAGRKWLMSTVA